MAKRFTDTEKWKKKFFRGLQSPYKLVWLYLLDECNHAGVWDVEFDVLKIRTGISCNSDEILKVFNGKIISFDNGEKWFIEEFINFQYMELNPENRAHKSVIDLLSLYENKGLTRGLQARKDKDKDKDKVKDKDKDFNFRKSFLDLGVDPNILDDWLSVRKTKKATNSETAFNAIKAQVEKSGLTANECIKKAAENSWSGFNAGWGNEKPSLDDDLKHVPTDFKMQ